MYIYFASVKSFRKRRNSVCLLCADKYKGMSWGINAALLSLLHHMGGIEGSSFLPRLKPSVHKRRPRQKGAVGTGMADLKD